MSVKSDISRDAYMLTESLAKKGFDLWQHSFTGKNARTGEEKTFFVEFFLCNPALAADRPVLGQAPENQAAGRYPSYLMVKAGCWGKNAKQIHRFFSWKRISLHETAPFSINAQDCLVSETYLKGSVTISPAETARHPEYLCQSGSMSWHLKINKKVPFHAGFPAGKFFRTVCASGNFRHSEGAKTEYEGTVTLDGEEYLVLPETSCGYAGKIWGSEFASRQIHFSSCDLLSFKTGRRLTDSAFEITGSIPSLFGRPKKHKLTGDIYYEGKLLEFRFLKFGTFPSTKFFCRETEDEMIWHIRQESLTALVKTELHCPKEDMLFMTYESPDGTLRSNRLMGGTGTGFMRLYKKSGRKRTLIDELVVRHARCISALPEDS